MRYSFEFKVKCIEMYERGEYPETPNGITTRKYNLYKGEIGKIADNIIARDFFA